MASIFISHRVSTIKDAHEILFLVDGEIVQRGTHNQLLSVEGEYKELYEKQLLEEKLSRG